MPERLDQRTPETTPAKRGNRRRDDVRPLGRICRARLMVGGIDQLVDAAPI